MTASARSFPVLACGIAALVAGKPRDASPLITAVMACGVLLYVTSVVLMPAMLSSIFADSRRAAPAVATLISPGRFFANAISSFTDFAGSEG